MFVSQNIWEQVMAINDKPEFTKYVHTDEEVVFVEQKEVFYEDVRDLNLKIDEFDENQEKVINRDVSLDDLTLAAKFLNTYEIEISPVDQNVPLKERKLSCLKTREE